MASDKATERDWLALARSADLAQALAERDRVHAERTRRLLGDFLGVLDSLDRAIALCEDEADGTLPTVRRQFLGAFERAGVRFFESVGLSFDPQRHEAMELVADPTHEPGIVLEELRRGCDWQGALLRAARVVVNED